MEKITWKTVFNTENHPGFWKEAIFGARLAAQEAYYPYFSWNGWVYETSSGEKTETLVEDIK